MAVLEVRGEGGTNGVRCTKVTYKQPVEISVNGKVVYSDFGAF